jgi:hypothetical protein
MKNLRQFDEGAACRIIQIRVAFVQDKAVPTLFTEENRGAA